LSEDFRGWIDTELSAEAAKACVIFASKFHLDLRSIRFHDDGARVEVIVSVLPRRVAAGAPFDKLSFDVPPWPLDPDSWVPIECEFETSAKRLRSQL
jgi:hypothetical protein